MSTSTIGGDFGELTIETEMVEVTSNLPRPDRQWRYTDRQGHEHYWQAGPEVWPTLVEVEDRTYWCAECGDEHTDTHLECRLCHEKIRPGMVGPSGFREFAPGRRTYLLNGEPIDEDRAKQILERARRGASGRSKLTGNS